MLTEKQLIVLEAIDYFIKERGYSPAIREIAELTQTGVSSTWNKVRVLEEKGYISTYNGKARTIKILKGIEEKED